jgi:imidazolonepropionase-like amidohydrolase
MFYRHALVAFLIMVGNSGFLSAESIGSASDVVALTGLSVVDVNTGRIIHAQTMLIENGIISYLGVPLGAEQMTGVLTHDHAGQYAIPGLWDMHVHFRGGPDLAEENRLWLRQYLGFGVTSVRDAGGDLPNEVLSWREAITAGSLIGPTIFTSLRKLDGANAFWPGSLVIDADEDVAPAIAELADAGADFIKLYDSTIDPELYLAAVREAKRRGLKTAGHVPLGVSFDDIVDAGLDSHEHELTLAKAASGLDAAISNEVAESRKQGEEPSYWNTLFRLSETPNIDRMNALFDQMVERDMAITPTLYVGGVFDGLVDDSIYLDDERLPEVPPGIRETYQMSLPGLLGRTAEERERDLTLRKRNITYFKAAVDRGVKILAGSDAGAFNPFIYPGHSLHKELEQLVAAGLTPLQALQAATINAAGWFGLTNVVGSLVEGRTADIVILRTNPLEDISNSMDIAAIVHSGRYYSSSEATALRKLPE